MTTITSKPDPKPTPVLDATFKLSIAVVACAFAAMFASATGVIPLSMDNFKLGIVAALGAGFLAGVLFLVKDSVAASSPARSRTGAGTPAGVALAATAAASMADANPFAIDPLDDPVLTGKDLQLSDPLFEDLDPERYSHYFNDDEDDYDPYDMGIIGTSTSKYAWDEASPYYAFSE